MQGKLEEICCPSCGGDDPAFDREHNIFKCRYCGSIFAVESDMLDAAIRASREGERAQRRAEQLAAARAHIARARSATRRLRVAIVASLVACALTLPTGMAACSLGLFTARSDQWPDTALVDMLPEPPVTRGKVLAIDGTVFKMELDMVSSLQFAEYQTECTEAGYDDFIKLPGNNMFFEAMNSEGCLLKLAYDDERAMMTVELEREPPYTSRYEFEDAGWPAEGLPALAPAPDKRHRIEVREMNSNWHSVYIDGMSRSEMDGYAEKCSKEGFDLSRDPLFGGYSGENADGVYLWIRYCGAGVTEVSASKHKRG